MASNPDGPGQAQVHDDHVRRVLAVQRKRVVGIVRLRGDGNVGSLLDHGAEGHPGQKVIFDDQNTNHLAPCAGSGATGSFASMIVPLPLSLSIFNSPPSRRARASMPAIPKCPALVFWAPV